MRFAVGSVISLLLVLALFANAMNGAPTPYSDSHQVFTPRDQRLLEADYPGGYYPNARLYVWCQPRRGTPWGDTVWMYADDRTVWPNRTCWRFPRQ